MRDLQVTDRPVTTLIPRGNNPRTHSKKQIRQIADSIREFGFLNPILIDADGGIVAGHGRVAAAKQIGIEAVPTIRLDHLTPDQLRAYVIADNRLAENAGWDTELLALELKGLSELDLSFDLTITGFETPEIDLMIQGLEPVPAEQPAPELDRSAPPVSRRGDLWQMDGHRLLCGDATDPDHYHRLMDWDEARMVITDPPYNVPIQGHVSGLGSRTHREFAMASGEMTEAEFTSFLATVFGHLAHHSIDGSIHMVFMDWRHMSETLRASRDHFAELKNLCVWVKTNGGMGSLYRSQHELAFVFKNGTASHVNNVELGKHGRYRTNVWRYAGANSFGSDRDEALAMHPTVKPVQMIADAILDCSHRGDVVLDPFGGSGTTLIAAEQTGRRAYLMELDPAYVDVIVERWQRTTGREAVHAESGEIFAATKAARVMTGGN